MLAYCCSGGLRNAGGNGISGSGIDKDVAKGCSKSAIGDG
jgi:hypothetical protein